MRRILFVVHRYYPYAGGSEYNVRNMAEEFVRRGYETWVLTNEHRGDQNGVRVTSDVAKIMEEWNLVIVHGSCPVQDVVLANIRNIKSPVLYMLIQPSHSQISQWGMTYAKYIGCGTSFDRSHADHYGHSNKIVNFKYGIPETSIGHSGFKEKFGIKTSKLFISAGGFWPHKRMQELRDIFVKLNLPDTTLVLMGYDNRHHTLPHDAPNVKVLLGTTHQDVLDAMKESDLYILNSSSEGFGLVLLEAMLNNCPWIATDIAGAHDMQSYGTVYTTEEHLTNLLKTHKKDGSKIMAAHQYVINNHMSSNCVSDIEKIL